MTGRWGVLLVLCLARTAMGLHLQVVAAVAPFMMADLGFGYGEIGVLIGVFMLTGILLAVPGGLASRRFGDTRTLAGGLVLVLVGTSLLALATGFWPAFVARVLSGAGGTLLTMQVAKITTDWFAGRELSTALGVLMGTFPLGIAAVMAGLPLVASATSWRVAVGLVALVTVAILVAVAVVLRDHPDARHERASRPPLWTLSRSEAGLAVLSGAAFSLVNAGLVIFTSFTPALLLQRGLDEIQAGWLASWTSWAAILTIPTAGLLLDRVRGMMRTLVIASVLIAATCLLAASTEPVGVWIVLFAVLIAPLAVGSMTLPGEVLRPESRASGFGLFFTVNYVGFGLLPSIAGWFVDATGSAATPLWFNGVVLLAIVPVVLSFRWLQRRQPPIIPARSVHTEGTERPHRGKVDDDGVQGGDVADAARVSVSDRA